MGTVWFTVEQCGFERPKGQNDLVNFLTLLLSERQTRAVYHFQATISGLWAPYLPPTAVPLLFFVPDQTEPGLMNQGGGLEGLVWGFMGHFGYGQLAQFFVDEGQQFLGRLRVAPLSGLKNPGNVAQPAALSRFSGGAPDNLH